MKRKFITIMATIAISGILVSSLFADEINSVDFTKYPLSKSLTAKSRGGDLPDKIAATDGMGTLKLKPVGVDTTKVNNSTYNNLIKKNLSKLDNNNSLNDLINSNKISVSQDVLDKINNNIAKITYPPGTCYGAPIGSTVYGHLVVNRTMLDNMIANGNDITNVCTSNITDMSYLFDGKTIFNQNISNWDTSHVTDMYNMFDGASNFNQPLNNWDVSNVTRMNAMFYNAIAFNQPLNNWDVSNVTRMNAMFYYATSFNQPLNNWDVSNVTRMNAMFSYSSNFNQDISSWDVSNVINWTDFSSNLSTNNKPAKFR